MASHQQENSFQGRRSSPTTPAADTESAADNSNQEVDLVEVLGKFGNFLWRFGAAIYNIIKDLSMQLFRLLKVCISFAATHFWWLAGTFAVSIGLSVLSNRQERAVYRSDMVARMNVGDNVFAVKYINDIGQSDNTPADWMQLLNIPDSATASLMKSLGAYWGVDYNGDGIMDVIDMTGDYNQPFVIDTATIIEFRLLTDRFYIVAEVYGPEVLPYIAKGLVALFQANPYLRMDEDVRRASLMGQIAAIDWQIKLLDSLQRYEYFNRPQAEKQQHRQLIIQPQGQMIELNDREQRLLHNDALPLYERRVQLQAELQRVNETTSLELLQDGTQVKIPQTHLIRQGATNLLWMMSAMVLFLLWRDRRRKARALRK